MVIRPLNDEESELSGIVWNRCACGQLKPKKGNTCWRCIERDQEFVRLDALIAAGYGSIQQSLIPKDIMERFACQRALVLRKSA